MTGWGEPGSPPPAGRRREWPVLLGAVAAVLVLAAGILVAIDRFGSHGVPHPSSWDPRVLDLVKFDERHRGLKFAHPVFVDFLTPEEYSKRARSGEGELTADDKQQLANEEGELRALGLVVGDVDLFQATNELADTGTLAFYDPETQRISIRGTELTVEVRVTLAHELTHVLQDQHFGVGDRRTAAFTTSGEDSAFRALLEGDAVRIEDEYIDSLSDEDRQAYDDANAADIDQATSDLSNVPVALQALQAAPYVYGPPFVQLLDALGGQHEIDDALTTPPTTDEQELDPRAFVDHDGAATVPTPSLPDGVTTSTDKGDFGATAWLLVLGERIDPLVALHAADGWAGDSYISYVQDGHSCMRLAWKGDTSEDEQEMHDALDAWEAAMPSGAATITDAGDELDVQSCDLGPSAGLQVNNRGLDVVQVVGLRTQLMESAVRDGGLDTGDAFTFANCVLDRLTYPKVQAALAEQSDELPADLQRSLEDAETTCIG